MQSPLLEQTKARSAENKEKIKKNTQLPFLVSNVIEILDPTAEDFQEEEGAAANADLQGGKGKTVVLKTTTRQV